MDELIEGIRRANRDIRSPRRIQYDTISIEARLPHAIPKSAKHKLAQMISGEVTSLDLLFGGDYQRAEKFIKGDLDAIDLSAFGITSRESRDLVGRVRKRMLREARAEWSEE